MKINKSTILTILSIVFLHGAAASAARAQNLKYICPDLNKEPCVQAKKMIIASQVIALGEEPKGDEWISTAEAMLSGPYADKTYEQKIKDGLKLSQAVDFWKNYLASAFTGDGTRMNVIKLAYFEVYGAFPVIEQNKFWIEQMNQKKAWYTQMVSTEQGKLYGDTELRKQVIKRVYSVTMGRTAEQKEIDYWLARKNDFRQMYHAARSYLYSNTPDANKDLHDTVRRALSFINKKNPSEDEIKAAIEKYKPGKKIHSEMIGKQLNYNF